MAVQHDNRSGEAVIVVDDKLQVSHCLVALIHQRCVLCAHRALHVIHLGQILAAFMAEEEK